MIPAPLIIHPKSEKGKYVYMYKVGGFIDMDYLRDSNDKILYFNSKEEAISKGGNKPCWVVSKIK